MVNIIKQNLTLEESLRKHNIFNKSKMEKATKHINDEMDDAAEEFYKKKKDKEKDSSFERQVIVFYL